MRLDDGTEIEIVERPGQGTRHTVLRGTERRSADRVVVKIERIAGALATERLALDWVGAHRGPAPTLRTASTLVLPDGRRTACLVMDEISGRAPDNNEGWQRMGRALAALAKLPWAGSGLRTQDAASFRDAHERRVRDLGAPLREAMTGVRDWPRLGSADHAAAGPLVLTHGDPGPGNFLHDGCAGTLLDWEEAGVAPRGLDLGRATFIALLGSGPTGFVARDHHARARSVANGYLASLEPGWAPSPPELRWWLTVAGVQFAHRRLQRAGRPGVRPWTDAITVLAASLRDDRAWTPA